MVLENLQRSRENLRDSPSGSRRPQGSQSLRTVQQFRPVIEWVEIKMTGSESIDIVLGAASSGLEALRRLVRRWDPLSGGKRTGSCDKS